LFKNDAVLQGDAFHAAEIDAGRNERQKRDRRRVAIFSRATNIPTTRQK
jgi:hypothetical protein